MLFSIREMKEGKCCIITLAEMKILIIERQSKGMTKFNPKNEELCIKQNEEDLECVETVEGAQESLENCQRSVTFFNSGALFRPATYIEGSFHNLTLIVCVDHTLFC